MNVRIEKFPAQRIAFVRHIGPYQDCGAAWGKLMMWAGPRGLVGPHSPPFGLAYDDPAVTPPDKTRYDACVAVGPNVEAEGEIGICDLPAGEYAVAVHAGPYENLKDTYDMLFHQWLPTSGRQPADGPCMEKYLNDARTTPPDQLRTEVCVRLA